MSAELEAGSRPHDGPAGVGVGFGPADGAAPVEWVKADGLVPYDEAVAAMEEHVTLIAGGMARERVWLVEHPPLYTAGTSAQDRDLVSAGFPVHRTGRGGRHTYHGPGQRVAYLMLDLQRRRPDVRAFVRAIEDWTIGTLGRLGVAADRRADRVGVWVMRPDKPAGPDGAPAEDKIAAIGIRVRRWVSFHGMALNVDPELGHFAGIVPCGISARHLGVTSLRDLGHRVDITGVDALLRAEFERIFGPTASVSTDRPPAPEG